MLVSILLALAVFATKTDTCIRTQPPGEITTTTVPITTTLVTTTSIATTTTVTETTSTTSSSTTTTSTTTSTSTTSTTTTTTTTTLDCYDGCEPITPGLPDVCPPGFFNCVPATTDILRKGTTPLGCGLYTCDQTLDIGVIAPDGTTYGGDAIGCLPDGHRYFQIGGAGGTQLMVDDYTAFCSSF